MATIQELETALVNADKAGDAQAATVLARELSIAKRMRGKFYGEPNLPSEQIGASPNPIARFGRGMMDLAQGAKQGFLNITDPAAAKEYTHGVDEEVRRYDKERPQGVDMLRFLGNASAAAPVAAAMTVAAPEALTASIIGRMALGSAQGATLGGMEFTPEGQSKARQVGFGGAAGAAGPWVADVAARVAAKLTLASQRGVTRLTTSPDDIVKAIQAELGQSGVDWNALGAEVKTNLMQQARRQLSATGELSPEHLARKLEMEDVLGAGAGPTQGQVTRNPAQWSWERNTQKTEAGPPLTDRYQAQVQRLTQRLNDAIDQRKAKAQNEYQAGEAAINAVNEKMDAAQKSVTDLYKVWRETGSGATEIKPQKLASTLGTVIDEYGVENIPPAVRARLESFGLLEGKQIKVLTIDEAEKLRKLIGNNIDPKNRPATGALTKLKSALDETVLESDTPNVPSLQAARSAARERFGMRDSSNATAAAAEGVEPDKFFRKYVLNGEVRDLRGLKAALTTEAGGTAATGSTEQAWRDVQAQTIRHLLETAQTKGKAGESFSGAAMKKAMKEIGDERLKVIFEPEQLAALQKYARVAENVSTEPAFAAVNHSNTAPTLAQYVGDVLRQTGKLPFVRHAALPVIGAWEGGANALKSQAVKQRVNQALTGEAVDPTGASDQYAKLVKMMADRMEPIASGAAIGGSLSSTQ